MGDEELEKTKGGVLQENTGGKSHREGRLGSLMKERSEV